MKKFVVTFLILLNSLGLFAQNLDLIVTTSNDSIACKIDSISLDIFYLTTRINERKILTSIKSEKVAKFEYGIIDKKRISRIPGTAYFKSKLSSLQTTDIHSIYISPSIGFYMMATINYELTLSYKPDAFFKTKSIFLGGGIDRAVSDGSGIHFRTGFTGLTGSGKKHFELGIGAAIIYDKENFKYAERDNKEVGLPPPILSWYLLLNPDISIGYRIQNPENNFIFRTGLGWPEMIYLSFGFRF